MKFPILIHLLNNKARHVVLSWQDLPVEHYFKILQTGIDPNNINAEIEVDYRWVDEEPGEEVAEIDQQTQENNEPSGADSADDGASNGSKNSNGTGI